MLTITMNIFSNFNITCESIPQRLEDWWWESLHEHDWRPFYPMHCWTCLFYRWYYLELKWIIFQIFTCICWQLEWNSSVNTDRRRGNDEKWSHAFHHSFKSQHLLFHLHNRSKVSIIYWKTWKNIQNCCNSEANGWTCQTFFGGTMN